MPQGYEETDNDVRILLMYFNIWIWLITQITRNYVDA